MSGQAITPFLWFDHAAEAAVEFWLGIFPAARVTKVLRYGKAGPGPEGSVMTIAFELLGMQYTAINGGPLYRMNGAISFVVHCDSQAEIDYYWERLGEGGTVHRCGWLTDRFGVTWQVVPRRLPLLLDAPDPEQRARVTAAMLHMVKLDLPALEAAAGPA